MGSILSCSGMKILSRMKSKNKGISRVEEISKYADWDVYLKKSSKEPARLTVVDFSASWCAPSNHLEPELNKLASNYTDDINFIKIDVDKLKTLAKDFKVAVVPTLVLLKQGKEVDKTEGGDIDAIKKMIDKQEPSKPAAAATTN